MLPFMGIYITSPCKHLIAIRKFTLILSFLGMFKLVVLEIIHSFIYAYAIGKVAVEWSVGCHVNTLLSCLVAIKDMAPAFGVIINV